MGLLPPSFLYGATLAQDNIGHLRADSDARIVQIHILPGHYVVSCQEKGKITIYDSVPSLDRSLQLLPQLKIRYVVLDNHPNPLSLVNYIVTQTHHGSSDCGLFAAAIAYLLITDQNPQHVILDQNALRAHLYNCLRMESVTAFPALTFNISDTAMCKYFTNSISLQQRKQHVDVAKYRIPKKSRSSYFKQWRSNRSTLAKKVILQKTQ